MKKLISYFLLVFMIGVLVLSGCSSEKEIEVNSEEEVLSSASFVEEPVEEVRPEVPAEDVLPLIGAEEEGAYKIRLTNHTGMDIKAVIVGAIEEEKSSDNLLAAEDVFVADEERYLYYKPVLEPEKETPEGQTEEADDEETLDVSCDVQLILADDSVYVLHAFPFEDMEEAELVLEDNVIYLKYTSISTQELIETKETELAIKAQQEAEVQKQAEAEAAAAVARQQAEAEAAAAAARQQTEAEAAAAAEQQPVETETAPAEPEPDIPQGDNEDFGEDQGCVGDEGLMW